MIRSTLKRGIKKALGIPSRPHDIQPTPASAPEPVVEFAPAAEPAIDEPAAGPVVAPVEVAPVEAPAEVAAEAMSADADTAGEPIDLTEVQEILDDMVRPALQSDGGDIALLKIENNDIYVKLVGACTSCPSSIMTMKLGVEALLKEEFPQMGELIQVD